LERDQAIAERLGALMRVATADQDPPVVTLARESN
jgi:hypothetical protein